MQQQLSHDRIYISLRKQAVYAAEGGERGKMPDEESGSEFIISLFPISLQVGPCMCMYLSLSFFQARFTASCERSCCCCSNTITLSFLLNDDATAHAHSQMEHVQDRSERERETYRSRASAVATACKAIVSLLEEREGEGRGSVPRSLPLTCPSLSALMC